MLYLRFVFTPLDGVIDKAARPTSDNAKYKEEIVKLQQMLADAEKSKAK